LVVGAAGASLGWMPTPPPRARSVTPVPTVPPPPDEPTLAGRVVKRLEAWQVLLAIAFALAAAGAGFATWSRSLATVDQLDGAKSSLTAQLGAVQGTTAVQLGTLQSEVQQLRERQVAVEASLDQLIAISERLLDVSLATAHATGARVPPDPSHPPPLPGGTP
jgi:hypothetical protein